MKGRRGAVGRRHSRKQLEGFVRSEFLVSITSPQRKEDVANKLRNYHSSYMIR
jgi:hypothetical protein